MILSRLLLGLAGFSVFARALLEEQPSEFIRGNGSLDLQHPKERETRDDNPPPRGRSLCSLRSILDRRYRPREIAPEITIDGNVIQDDEVSIAEGNSSHVSVHKRTMTLPDDTSEGAMDRFMIRECDSSGVELMVWNSVKDGVSREVNNARFIPFPSHGKESNAAVELAGCTSLVIYSRKGIYSGHYWENIGFSLDEDKHGDLYSDQEDAFQKSIIDALRDGATSDEGVDHRSLSEVADRINDESIQAFLIIPATGQSDDDIGPPDPYRDAWERMKTQIGEIIPALADEARWSEYKYHPTQEEEVIKRLNPSGEVETVFHPLIHTARGKVLVKYDKPRGEAKKLVKIWAERDVLFEDEWSELEDAPTAD